MTKIQMSSARKKKIKTLLSMMNKQNQRLVPVAPPLIEMMDLVSTDDELDYLISMGTGLYTYKKAAAASRMSDENFQTFFDTIKRKGFVYIDYDESGHEHYRLNAIAVGWYEVIIYYLKGKPQEKAFSEKCNEYFKFFLKFNFFPLRNVQNLILRNILTPNQDTALMNMETKELPKCKELPINVKISYSGNRVYPTFLINNLLEEYGSQNEIYVFPCVCRYSSSLVGSKCEFDTTQESCFGFNNLGRAWASLGYGRKISKTEAIEIFKEVRDNGAIHSVVHEKDDPSQPVINVCNCCWDCCSILKPYNMGAFPLKYNASFTAQIKDDANCKGCGDCEKYCPTTAMKLIDGKVSLNSDKCIGCGQCAYQCKQNNIELYPNKRTVFLPMLKKSEARITA